MKCPKCNKSFTGVPDESGFYLCPACGARLRSRAPAPHTKAPPLAPPPKPDPTATLPPGTPLKRIPRPEEMAAAAAGASLETVLAEIRVVRQVQEEILALLKGAHSAPAPAPVEEEAAGPAMSGLPVRARRRKTVLLVDDEDGSRKAALAAFEAAQVPARHVADGNAALAAIAADKPDVIVMELDIGGPMAGKDVINMIKATMEWVDIPIVLFTRLPIESQKEARTIHGADELVIKGPGAAETLVSRVIAIFRRG